MFSTCHAFIPPNPVNRSIYKCDKVFHLDHLLDLYKTYDTYAIVLVSGKRSDFYLYSKNNTVFVQSIKSDLPNQHKTGGSSAPRFGRIRDEKICLHMRRICESMVRIFCSDGKFNHIGLYVAGPAELKDRIQTEDLFESYFKKYLVQTLTIGEITDQTIGLIAKMIGQVTEINTVSKTGDIIASFEAMIANPETFDLIVFGIQNVLDELDTGSIAEVFIVNDTIGDLLPENFKGVINIIGSKSFEEKYGSIVGIKYFASENFDLITETDVSGTNVSGTNVSGQVDCTYLF